MNKVELTKSLIISEAVALFNTKGFKATSISDITKAAGVTKGSIYGNFENKDAVAVAAFDFAINKVIDELRVRIKNEKTAPLKLKAIVDYYENYIENPPIQGGCPIWNSVAEVDDNFPQLRVKLIRTIQLLKSSIAKIIYRGIQEGQITRNVNAEQFSVTFYAAIGGAVSMSRLEGDLGSYHQIKNYLNQEIDHITTK